MIYKIFQVTVILFFAYFVSDFRKKNITKQLLSPTLLIAMKLAYMVPLIIFLSSVIRTERLLITDLLSLGITLVGLGVVAFAKLTLGKNHSWTGYGTFPEVFCTGGVFSYVRHPMYSGIITCIIGMVLHVVFHASLALILINIIYSAFIVYVLTSSAKAETDHLLGLFGEDYQNYIKQVHPFFPVRKYANEASTEQPPRRCN